MYRQIITIAILALLSSCAMPGVKQGMATEKSVTAGMILDASPLDPGGAVDQNLDDFDMLEITPEMVAFLDEKVKTVDSHNEQLRRLAWAIMRSGEFSLVYDDSTGTASETFVKRSGNCMAFTNMFIALSRHLGLDARFQEVDVPPTWSMSGESLLYSQHINVFINLKNGHEREVDFNIYDFDHEMESRIISDERAAAHYFNNIGAEHMLDGETDLAYAYFRQSILRDDGYAPAWINMGILHRRQGMPEYAEVAFLQAL